MPKIDIVNAKNIIESNPEKAFFKLKNTGGPKGDTGAQGPQGPKGDTGAQGAPGASASVTVGSTTTLSAGADATVTNSGDTRNAILNFGIPTGAQGPQGIQGPKGDTGPMGQTGAKGDTGAAATVQVGNTNTGAPGTNAQVTNAGNEHFAVFNFTIPRGDKGETGSTGPQGPKGDTGEQGPQGIQGPKGDTGSVKSDVVAELPETGEEDTFYLVNREATEQTATGKAISFTNNDNAGDITDFKLDGETSQNGTPTPDAPVAVKTTTGENVVKICGKNLLEYESRFTPYSNYGLTTTMDATTGIITINGTFTGTSPKDIPLINNSVSINIFQNYSYYIGIKYISGSKTGDPNFTARTVLSSGSYYWNNAVPLVHEDRSVLCNINNAVRFDTIRFFVPVGATFDNYKVLPYINANETGYEPYQGQSYEVNLGKNLINFGSYQQSWDGASVDGEGTTITMSPNTSGSMGLLYDSTTYSVSIPAGRTITWSRTWAGGGTWESGTITFPLKLTYADGTTETLSFGDTTENNYSQVISATKTLAKPVVSVKIESGGCFGITNLTAPTSFNLQLELGSQATSYAAYFEPIELCKIGDYQDYIWKDGSDWKIHKVIAKAVIDGTSGTWSKPSTNRFNVDSLITGYKKQSALFNAFCDRYIALGESNDNAGFNTAAADYSYAMNFTTSDSWNTVRFKNTDYDDLGDFKTHLGSNPATIYYILATPTDTEITNEALVAQLDALLNNARTYAGVNNIFTVTPNEVPTLEIDYVTYDKYNQNKVYIWNDTLQQWQIIVQ